MTSNLFAFILGFDDKLTKGRVSGRNSLNQFLASFPI